MLNERVQFEHVQTRYVLRRIMHVSCVNRSEGRLAPNNLFFCCVHCGRPVGYRAVFRVSVRASANRSSFEILDTNKCQEIQFCFLKQGGMPEFRAFLRDIWGKLGGHLEDFWRNFAGQLEDVKRRLEGKNLVF